MLACLLASYAYMPLQIFTPEGKFVRKFGTRGAENGQFHFPWGVDVDGVMHAALLFYFLFLFYFCCVFSLSLSLSLFVCFFVFFLIILLYFIKLFVWFFLFGYS